ncbi:MAG: hypothetical protein ACL7AX_12995 [Candidatus Arsenophonus phytopathogenicus]
MSREHKVQFKWKYCWTKGGKVLLRKSDSSKVFPVTSVEGLNEFFRCDSDEV